jgi:hypothetical protein
MLHEVCATRTPSEAPPALGQQAVGDRLAEQHGIDTSPWLEKFRGLSKPRLEQSARTYGFGRTLNLVGAPLHGLIDCFALNVFHQTR